ncbi:MAG: response regulator transcription factor [Bryobacteraceae bacterium]
MPNEARHRILMVDDDVKLCELIRDYFEPMGFDLAFAHSGPDGLRDAGTQCYDAIILDVMLPGLDGFEVLRRLRAASEAPVVMLTGRGEDTDRIVGLELGADDYVPKTSSTRELLARVRAVLRRTSAAGARVSGNIAIEIDGLSIHAEMRAAALDGAHLPLTPVEFGILLALARARGRVLSREQLLHQVSDRELEVFDRSIDVHVSSLRRKLGDDSRNPRFIQTVRAAGYRLAAFGEL